MHMQTAETAVSKGTQYYDITPNLESLARPKMHSEGPFRDAQWIVSEAAKQAIPRERLHDLAKAKKTAEGYQPSREALWKVGVGALNAVSSNRYSRMM